MGKTKNIKAKEKMIKLPQKAAELMGHITLLVTELVDDCDFNYEDTPEERATSISSINLDVQILCQLKNLLEDLNKYAEENEHLFNE